MTRATNITSTAPITEDWKISDVLQVHPALLDVLVETTPAFRKLRNPLLRKVQSKLVTVGQAAAIAGMEPATLVQTLNAAAGIDAPTPTPTAPAGDTRLGPEPPWVSGATEAEQLDVRPYQQRGEEPFSAIMEAIRRVPRGQVFVLRNTFEPAPLYGVLEQWGFEHWARQIGEQDWEIRFFNSGSPRDDQQPATAKSAPPPADSWDAPSATLTIDVSELVPPEPMVRILTALEDLPAGATLLVHHVRRPMHLYPRLDELGYRHETRDLAPGRVEVLIEKPAAPAATPQ